jgi:uncharacterized damage-inducible protein DinB
LIAPAHARLMARYNRWQNESLFDAADGLPDSARRQERGAFFGSIHGTFCHLLWGDAIWMHRFAGSEKPPGGIGDSASLVTDWEQLRARRSALDEAIIAWADGLEQAWLEGSISWRSGVLCRDVTRPAWLLAAHFFNHQTHHRGQIHAMLTAAGAMPQDTDLMILPDLREQMA